MKIELKCKCGAEIKFTDELSSYINKGGERDEKGRVFLIQEYADAWLNRHSDCLKLNNTLPPPDKDLEDHVNITRKRKEK